jgi:hypothetical protein
MIITITVFQGEDKLNIQKSLEVLKIRKKGFKKIKKF